MRRGSKSAVLVVGPGALGGLVATRWTLRGRQVVLAGPSRGAERLAVRGWRVDSPSGPLESKRALLTLAGGSVPPAAAFLAVKTYSLEPLERLRRRLEGDFPVVSLSNGLGHAARLREAFGGRRFVAGAAFVACDRPGAGRLHHSAGRAICLARTPENAAAAGAAAALLEEAGWDVRLADDEAGMLWTKLVLYVSMNPLAALLGVDNGALRRDAGLRATTEEAAREAVKVALACGAQPLRGLLPNLPRKEAWGEGPNSLLRDLRRGGRTELDETLGTVVRLARERGVAVPLLSHLEAALAWRTRGHTPNAPR